MGDVSEPRTQLGVEDTLEIHVVERGRQRRVHRYGAVRRIGVDADRLTRAS